MYKWSFFLYLLFMETIILGFSGGVESIDSPNTSLLIRTGKTSILVDVSGSPRMALLNANQDPDTLDAILLTHGHIDHVYGLPALIHNMWLTGRTKPLRICGNPKAITTGKHLFLFFALDQKIKFEISWEELPISTIGDIEVVSFDLFHRPQMPVCGFTFSSAGKKISYFPDSVAREPYPVCTFDSDVLLHEVGGLEKDKEKINVSHTTAFQAAMLAKKTGAGKLIPVHLPPDVQQRKAILSEIKQVFPKAYLPTIGETY